VDLSFEYSAIGIADLIQRLEGESVKLIVMEATSGPHRPC
jgi:hypothetical protein